MPTKQQIITIGVLCVVALGLGYWSGPSKKGSGQRAEVVAPTIITNVVKEVVTNIVAVASQPTPTPALPNTVTANTMNPKLEMAIREKINKPTGELTKADYERVTNLSLYNKQLTSVKGLEKLTQLKELELRHTQLTDVKGLEKLTKLKELTLAYNKLTTVKSLEKLTQLTSLNLNENQLTSVKGLEKLTQLRWLSLYGNQLTSVKGLEKLTQLEELWLNDNPDLTKDQIAELQKALPKCKIYSNAKK